MKRILLGLAVVTMALAAACAANRGSHTYTVRPGDTLSGIAAAHGTSADELVRLNEGKYPSLRNDPGLIRVGWELTVPGRESATRSAAGGPARLVVSPVERPTAALHNMQALPTEEQLRQVEQEIIRLTNEARRAEGLHELEVDPVLMEIARERARQLPGNYSHYGPNGEVLCRELAAQRGYGNAHALAENIGSGPKMTASRYSDLAFTSGWLSSEGHRANIMHPQLTRIGVGVFCGSPKLLCHGVQVFAP